MKRFRNICIAFALGLVGFTSLSGTASAASYAPQASNAYGVPYTYSAQPCPFYQLIPYGNFFQQYAPPVKQQVPQKQQQAPAPTQKPAAPAQNQQQANQPSNQQAPAAQQEQAAASFTKQVADLVNQERAKAGLAPLQFDSSLNKVAQAKAADMAQNNYFDHNSPTYGSPFDMMKQFGVSYRTAGENIAMGQRSPQEVMEQWMNSQGHRQNILNGSFTKIGVGYVNGYWVQEFTG
jgi:uncharacterized YkwD family protein